MLYWLVNIHDNYVVAFGFGVVFGVFGGGGFSISRVSGLSFSDGVKGSIIQEGLTVESMLLHIERRRLWRFGHINKMPSGCLLDGTCP